MKCKNAVKRGADSLQNVAYFSNNIFFGNRVLKFKVVQQTVRDVF